MKKFLAIILSILMVFSLAACGDTEKETDNNTNTESTEIKDRTPEEIKEYYQTYFGSSDLGFAGSSIAVKSDGMDITVATTKDGEGLFSIGVLDNKMEIYKDKSGKQFVHVVLAATEATEDKEATEATDTWYRFVPSKESTAEDEDIFTSMSSDFNTDELAVKQENIKNIEYVETKEGIDYIKVTQTVKDEDTGETNDEVWDIGINASTHKIVTISQTVDDIVQTVTFSNTDKIDVKVPENVEECDEETVAGLYMAIIFSLMGEGLSN